MTHRFSREELLIGKAGLEKLQQARVAVFGIGGVGSYVVEALARSGVGALDLFDSDTVALSNINRQLIALESTLGRPKVEAAKERVLQINPACRVEARTLFYLPGEDGASGPLLSGLDYVADAIDTVTAKLSLAEECARREIPLISAMGCGNKLDPTLFRVADIYETRVCPLCRIMRRELKARNISSLKVVYSEEPPVTPENFFPEGGGETPPEGRRALPGSLSFVPSVAGLILAGEIIRDIAGRKR